MHMSDALLSVAVGTTMNVVSTGTIGYSVSRIKRYEPEENKIPMMGVMGAFIFAAQMINFTIPVTGSSGHIGGGILLAALLGPFPAVITLASVLLIQCLFFADGGLLALGCNIFNMAIIPCLIAYPFLYKRILRSKLTPKRITIATILSVIVGLQLGAFGVVLETLVSGVTELPFGAFVVLMQPIHLAIGIVEGVVSAAVLCFIYRTRKDILENALGVQNTPKLHMKRVYVGILIVAIFLGGFVSWFASSKPDGLEWAIQKVTNKEELTIDSEVHNELQQIQNATALLPDYSVKSVKPIRENVSTGLSGVIGGCITLFAVTAFGTIIMLIKKRK